MNSAMSVCAHHRLPGLRKNLERAEREVRAQWVRGIHSSLAPIFPSGKTVRKTAGESNSLNRFVQFTENGSALILFGELQSLRRQNFISQFSNEFGENLQKENPGILAVIGLLA